MSTIQENKPYTIEYLRQEGIYNPKDQKVTIHVVGAGSTGSIIALTLAKMGIETITVWDFDKIEPHNIPNQYYRIKDIGKPKTEALAEIIEEFTGKKIHQIKDKIEDFEEVDVSLNDIFILCLDNMETRQTIHKTLKQRPTKIIDVRMGGEDYEIYYINTAPINEEEEEILLEYEKSLKQETVNLPCGERSIIYTLNSISAETAKIVKEIDQNNIKPTIIKRNMNKHMFLGGVK